jgi:hypothetical protein
MGSSCIRNFKISQRIHSLRALEQEARQFIRFIRKVSVDFFQELMFEAEVEESKNNEKGKKEREDVPQRQFNIRSMKKFSPGFQGHIRFP